MSDDEARAFYCPLESLGRRMLERGVRVKARTYPEAEDEILDLYSTPEERTLFILAAILDAVMAIHDRRPLDVGDEPKGATDEAGPQCGSPPGP